MSTEMTREVALSFLRSKNETMSGDFAAALTMACDALEKEVTQDELYQIVVLDDRKIEKYNVQAHSIQGKWLRLILKSGDAMNLNTDKLYLWGIRALPQEEQNDTISEQDDSMSELFAAFHKFRRDP